MSLKFPTKGILCLRGNPFIFLAKAPGQNRPQDELIDIFFHFKIRDKRDTTGLAGQPGFRRIPGPGLGPGHEM